MVTKRAKGIGKRVKAREPATVEVNVPDTPEPAPTAKKRGRARAKATTEIAGRIQTFIAETDGWVARSEVMHELDITQNQWLCGIAALMDDELVARRGYKKGAEYELVSNLDQDTIDGAEVIE
ncbi:MAG: hypothetical protein ACXABY_01420 [Candidatus Thorarchaeota archaeon]|jgi:hypothetical protein